MSNRFIAVVLLAPFASAGFGGAPLHAAVITHVGNDVTTAHAWRSTDVAKPLDIDGNNYYGTDGYNNIFGFSTPTYLEFSFADPSPNSQGSVENVTGDDPTDPAPGYGPGPRPQLAGGNYFFTDQLAGAENDFFVIKLLQSGSFRLAVMNDANDTNLGGQESAVQVRVRQTAGVGSGDSGYVNVAGSLDDGQLDYYFFDISGLADDEFVISGVNDATFSENALMGLAYDSISAVPEPSTLALTALGTAGYGRLSRRRARRNAAA